MVLIKRQPPWSLIVQDLEHVVVIGLKCFAAGRLHAFERVKCVSEESQEMHLASRTTQGHRQSRSAGDSPASSCGVPPPGRQGLRGGTRSLTRRRDAPAPLSLAP